MPLTLSPRRLLDDRFAERITEFNFINFRFIGYRFYWTYLFIDGGSLVLTSISLKQIMGIKKKLWIY